MGFFNHERHEIHENKIDSDLSMTPDCNDIYKEQRRSSGHKPRSPEEWDRRAASMSEDVRAENDYLAAFVRFLDFAGCRTALDLGCGPGGLLLPLAAQLEHVTGVDFSTGMLREARRNLEQAGRNNVDLIHADWYADWQALPAADMVIASRCLDADDMLEALRRLDALAGKCVHVSYRIGRSFLDDNLLEALGRDIEARPDHELIVRILSGQMGIEPSVNVIETPAKRSVYPTLVSFLARIRWTLGSLSAGEEARATEFFERLPEADEGGRAHVHPIAWAMISWRK